MKLSNNELEILRAALGNDDEYSLNDGEVSKLFDHIDALKAEIKELNEALKPENIIAQLGGL